MCPLFYHIPELTAFSYTNTYLDRYSALISRSVPLFRFSPLGDIMAKCSQVLHISHDLGRRGENAILDGSTSGLVKRKREESQRKAFLLELGTMIRLRSPYTVDVYGAVTSIHDRLILVMELLAGGDLRTLLKNAEQPLPEKQCWQIIGDICAGMAFLHTKKTVHGDLKSANVLLDGAGRAKVRVDGGVRYPEGKFYKCLTSPFI